MPLEFIGYREVLARIGNGRAYALLGNGFSIGCDPVFRYGSLYEVARDRGLSERAQAVFQRMGTNNFEGVLRSLDDASWIGRLYGLPNDAAASIASDSEIIKAALVDAVAHSHLEHAGLVQEARKRAANSFLSPYHGVFTTNCDLLLYWVVMAHPDRPPFGDGFRPLEDDPEDPLLVFSGRLGESPGLYFLHGALHLYVQGSDVCKHSWVREGQRLTELIRAGLAAGRYPLFVAEGTPDKKREQIERHGYLWYCLDKFARIESPLVVYGHSLGPSDAHLTDAIAMNRKLREVYISVFGGADSAAATSATAVAEQMIATRERMQARRRGVSDLRVTLYAAESALVWGE